MKQEGTIRHQLPDGSSVLIPFSKYMKMSEEDFMNVNAGMTGRYPKLPEHAVDFDEPMDDEIDDDLELDEDIDIDHLYDNDDV